MFIICWLLHPDPQWRATMSDLEENEWINQHVDITKYSFDAVMGQLIFCYQLNTLVKAFLQDPQLYTSNNLSGSHHQSQVKSCLSVECCKPGSSTGWSVWLLCYWLYDSSSFISCDWSVLICL